MSSTRLRLLLRRGPGRHRTKFVPEACGYAADWRPGGGTRAQRTWGAAPAPGLPDGWALSSLPRGSVPLAHRPFVPQRRVSTPNGPRAVSAPIRAIRQFPARHHPSQVPWLTGRQCPAGEARPTDSEPVRSAPAATRCERLPPSESFLAPAGALLGS